jgi:hypothetical protein
MQLSQRLIKEYIFLIDLNENIFLIEGHIKGKFA